jgi:hypothetical protein
METLQAKMSAHGRVIAEFYKLKAREPERVRRNNWSPAAQAMVGVEVGRDDPALMEAARQEVERQATFTASPEGRYVAGLHAAIRLSGEVALAATAGLEAASRGWESNQATIGSISADLVSTAQRLLAVACMTDCSYTDAI